jgi:hypothetical protein
MTADTSPNVIKITSCTEIMPNAALTVIAKIMFRIAKAPMYLVAHRTSRKRYMLATAALRYRKLINKHPVYPSSSLSMHNDELSKSGDNR